MIGLWMVSKCSSQSQLVRVWWIHTETIRFYLFGFFWAAGFSVYVKSMYFEVWQWIVSFWSVLGFWEFLRRVLVMINMDADAFFHGNLWLGGKKELCYFVKLLLAYWTLEQPIFLLLSIPILLILFFVFPFFWNLCLNFTEMASIVFSLCCYLKH